MVVVKLNGGYDDVRPGIELIKSTQTTPSH